MSSRAKFFAQVGSNYMRILTECHWMRLRNGLRVSNALFAHMLYMTHLRCFLGSSCLLHRTTNHANSRLYRACMQRWLSRFRDGAALQRTLPWKKRGRERERKEREGGRGGGVMHKPKGQRYSWDRKGKEYGEKSKVAKRRTISKREQRIVKMRRMRLDWGGGGSLYLKEGVITSGGKENEHGRMSKELTDLGHRISVVFSLLNRVRKYNCFSWAGEHTTQTKSNLPQA